MVIARTEAAATFLKVRKIWWPVRLAAAGIDLLWGQTRGINISPFKQNTLKPTPS